MSFSHITGENYKKEVTFRRTKVLFSRKVETPRPPVAWAMDSSTARITCLNITILAWDFF